MILGRCAERTSRIGLGPAVLVPSLRHPMVNAAAIAALAELAPGRVAVAVGAGFTGRRALGQRPMRWSDVAGYVRVLRELLRGEESEWAGAAIQMLHTPGYGASRPLEVPILIAAGGPKGTAAAKELADGVFSVITPHREAASFSWCALLSFGTVLGDGEDLASPRVAAALGPGAAVLYHAAYTQGGTEAIDSLPRRASLAGVGRGGPRDRTAPRRSHRPSCRAQRARSRPRPRRDATRGPDIADRQRRRSGGQACSLRHRRRHRGRLPAGRARHPPRTTGFRLGSRSSRQLRDGTRPRCVQEQSARLPIVV